MKHIFEPFGTHTQFLYNSHGIGLSICKQICVKMKGGISVESQEGIGSTFEFVMRAWVSQKAKSKTEASKQKPVKKKANLDAIREESEDSRNSDGQQLMVDQEDSANQVLSISHATITEVSFQGNLIKVDKTAQPVYQISDEQPELRFNDCQCLVDFLNENINAISA